MSKQVVTTHVCDYCGRSGDERWANNQSVLHEKDRLMVLVVTRENGRDVCGQCAFDFVAAFVDAHRANIATGGTK